MKKIIGILIKIVIIAILITILYGLNNNINADLGNEEKLVFLLDGNDNELKDGTTINCKVGEEVDFKFAIDGFKNPGVFFDTYYYEISDEGLVDIKLDDHFDESNSETGNGNYGFELKLDIKYEGKSKITFKGTIDKKNFQSVITLNIEGQKSISDPQDKIQSVIDSQRELGLSADIQLTKDSTAHQIIYKLVAHLARYGQDKTIEYLQDNKDNIKNWNATVQSAIRKGEFGGSSQGGVTYSDAIYMLQQMASSDLSDEKIASAVSNNYQDVKDDYLNKMKEYTKLIEKYAAEQREDKGPIIDVLSEGGTSLYKPTDLENQDAKKMTDAISKVLSIISSVGMVLSVIILAILGVKYMLASVEQKVDLKAGLIPYGIGAILLFGICGIVKLLQNIGSSINNI